MKYEELLDKALSDYKSFGLVWRDDLDYNSDAVEFDKKLRHLLISEKRDQSWPGTTLQDGFATIKFYKVTHESVEILRQVGSSFNFLSPSYPEDLFFSDAKEVVYASCAHEKLEWFR